MTTSVVTPCTGEHAQGSAGAPAPRPLSGTRGIVNPMRVLVVGGRLRLATTARWVSRHRRVVSRGIGRAPASALLAITVLLALAAFFGPRPWLNRAAMGTSTADPAAGEPTSRPLTVVGLGDSVTAGAKCDCTNFVDLLATMLSARDHVPTTAVNLGVGGLTAAGMVEQLRDTTVSRTVAAGDVVVITIGANDLQPALDWWDSTQMRVADQGGCSGACDDATLDAVGTDVAAVVARVGALRGGRPTQVLVTDYWNVFEDGAIARADRGTAYLAWSDALTRRLNARICAAAAADATCVDLYVPFKGDGTEDPTALLADDGDHPDADGHKVISQALLSALPSPAPPGVPSR